MLRASLSGSASPWNGSSGDTRAIATARSASIFGSDEAVAPTLATRLPTNTRSEMSSLSEASVDSTLPRRTETPAERPIMATASAASAPALRAASTRRATRSVSRPASILSFMRHIQSLAAPGGAAPRTIYGRVPGSAMGPAEQEGWVAATQRSVQPQRTAAGARLEGGVEGALCLILDRCGFGHHRLDLQEIEHAEAQHRRTQQDFRPLGLQFHRGDRHHHQLGRADDEVERAGSLAVVVRRPADHVDRHDDVRL